MHEPFFFPSLKSLARLESSSWSCAAVSGLCTVPLAHGDLCLVARIALCLGVGSSEYTLLSNCPLTRAMTGSCNGESWQPEFGRTASHKPGEGGRLKQPVDGPHPRHTHCTARTTVASCEGVTSANTAAAKRCCDGPDRSQAIRAALRNHPRVRSAKKTPKCSSSRGIMRP